MKWLCVIVLVSSSMAASEGREIFAREHYTMNVYGRLTLRDCIFAKTLILNGYGTVDMYNVTAHAISYGPGIVPGVRKDVRVVSYPAIKKICESCNITLLDDPKKPFYSTWPQ